jgi:hypothetical protein
MISLVKQVLVTRGALTLLCMASMSLSGCILVPFIQAFKETGATEGDRMALLSEEVKKFNAAVVWGNPTEAMTFVAGDSQLKLSSQFKDKSEDERIVETKVDSVEWGDAARTATVSVKVRYFRVPVYVVNVRKEEQQWQFTMGEGWKIKDRVVKEG